MGKKIKFPRMEEIIDEKLEGASNYTREIKGILPPDLVGEIPNQGFSIETTVLRKKPAVKTAKPLPFGVEIER